MDEYFGFAYLLIFLVAGLVLAVLGLLILNNEVKCELEKNKKQKEVAGYLLEFQQSMSLLAAPAFFSCP